MLKKVLIVEDLDSIGYGIAAMLKQNKGIIEITMSQYCDDAYLKFLKAQKDKTPYDLIITDLSFKKDYRNAKIESGRELIKKIREHNTDLHIIVYSVEERKAVIKELIDKYQVKSYVLKGRNGLKNIMTAINEVDNGTAYLSPYLTEIYNRKEVFEIEQYDIKLLKCLSQGLTQDEISKSFLEKGIAPSSLSSIEKRLNRLKEEFKSKTTTHLISITKDLGII